MNARGTFPSVVNSNSDIRTLRLLTFNLGLSAISLGRWKFSLSPHAEGRLVASIRALASAEVDIIALQEVYHPRDREFLVQSLGRFYPFHFASDAAAFIGNGLLIFSRFPIANGTFTPFNHEPLAERVLRRGFLTADIDIDGFGVFTVVNTHLSASNPLAPPEARAAQRKRAAEIDAIVGSHMAKGAILMGDFNTGPTFCRPNYDYLLASGFVDAYAFAHGDERTSDVTWDRNGLLNRRSIYRHEPSQRIDHIFISHHAHRALQPILAEIVFREPVSGEVPLSDHFGVRVTLTRRSIANYPNDETES